MTPHPGRPSGAGDGRIRTARGGCPRAVVFLARSLDRQSRPWRDKHSKDFDFTAILRWKRPQKFLRSLLILPCAPESEIWVLFLVPLVPARKIPDAVCRREGPCGPPPSEGDEPPPYRHPGNGIFIRCGDRERS